MRKTANLLLVLILATPCFGDVTVTSDVVYGHKDGMALIYDVFRPEKGNGAGIIFMMSGGWFSRWSPSDALASRFAALTDAGHTVFAVYHGSSPRYYVPEAYADVSRAVRHIKQNAAQYGVDPERLGVTGGSAGGHLALMVGLNSDNGNAEDPDPVLRGGNRVKVVVAYYPPVDIRPMAGRPSERFPALNFDKELAPGISPILFVSKDDPPTLLIHGDADTLVPVRNSTAIHQALQEQGVITDLIVIDGGDHGFRNEEHRQRADKARLAWFDKYL